MEFEWDAQKHRTNVEKHGVAFERIADFEIITALVTVDDRRDYGEVRLVGIGLVGAVPMVVVFTERDGAVRIISLRPANKKEIRVYVESL